MRIRKEIKLPSGGLVTIRPPSMLDVLPAGPPPASLQRSKPDEKRQLTEPELAWHIRYQRAVLLHCTGRLLWTKPERTARLVDKPFDECRDTEMTVEDLSDADAAAILEAVEKLRQEAAEAVQTFPSAQPQDDDNAGRNGEALLRAADEPALAV